MAKVPAGSDRSAPQRARRVRLDRELVRRGLARSREEAVAVIRDGRVRVDGRPAVKPATEVAVSAAVVVADRPEEPRWASRGAHKLIGALDQLPELEVAGRRCLDAGASTGGFTDVLLHRGAAAVVAVDVGYGQLDWRLRTDPRVRVLERTNVRHLRVADLPVSGVAPDGSGGAPDGSGGAPRPEEGAGALGVDLVVADLSFISLRTVLPALTGLLSREGDMLVMVKPQFEVGPARVGKGGVVREASLRSEAVVQVADAAWELGWGVCGLVTSPLPGPSGNREYFLWLRRDGRPLDPATATQVVAADGAWRRTRGAA